MTITNKLNFPKFFKHVSYYFKVYKYILSYWFKIYDIPLAAGLGIPPDAERKNTLSCVICRERCSEKISFSCTSELGPAPSRDTGSQPAQELMHFPSSFVPVRGLETAVNAICSICKLL